MTDRTPLHLSLATICAGAFVLAAMGRAPAPRSGTVTLRATATDTAVFAGGCFWGVEGVFEHVNGVISATAGYAGGSVRSPSYEEVSS
ncbi:MAG: peptide-methionine (S)-S-oxide reductase, partial [Gemmatimonadales bacterium]